MNERKSGREGGRESGRESERKSGRPSERKRVRERASATEPEAEKSTIARDPGCLGNDLCWMSSKPRSIDDIAS